MFKQTIAILDWTFWYPKKNNVPKIKYFNANLLVSETNIILAVTGHYFP